MATADFRVSEQDDVGAIWGPEDYILRLAEQEFGSTIYCRGSRLTAESEAQESADKTVNFLERVYLSAQKKHKSLSPAEVNTHLAATKEQFGAHAQPKLGHDAAIASDEIIRTGLGEVIPCTPCQRRYIEAIKKHDLTFAVGPAGTGKTFLAVASAVAHFRQRQYDRIILCRPAVEAGGEKIGFLPGDIREKIDPYMQPLYDALRELTPPDQLARWFERRSVEISPLAFMRGRTLKNAFIILDEAQNAAPVQMKMFLTRLGEGSKMVVCGDESQIDLPGGARSGLTEAMHLTENMPGVAQIRFVSADVIRHPLVRRIVEAYERKQESMAGRP